MPRPRRPSTCNASINVFGRTIRLLMLFLRVSMVTSSSGPTAVCRFSNLVIALLIINYSCYRAASLHWLVSAPPRLTYAVLVRGAVHGPRAAATLAVAASSRDDTGISGC